MIAGSGELGAGSKGKRRRSGERGGVFGPIARVRDGRPQRRPAGSKEGAARRFYFPGLKAGASTAVPLRGTLKCLLLWIEDAVILARRARSSGKMGWSRLAR